MHAAEPTHDHPAGNERVAHHEHDICPAHDLSILAARRRQTPPPIGSTAAGEIAAALDRHLTKEVA